MIKIGKKLEATDPCVMIRTGEESLIVGKEYEIIDTSIDDEDGDCIIIIDEQKERHYFPIEELSKWFKWFKTSN
jgi:hypothetical protein